MSSGDLMKGISEAQEGLSELSLNKYEAWEEFATSLEALSTSFRGYKGIDLLPKCARAMREGFKELDVSGRMDLVESVMAVLQEIKGAIQGKREPNTELLEKRLAAYLPEFRCALGEGRVDLDQIADLLIRAEPEEIPTVEKLVEGIKGFLRTNPMSKGGIESWKEGLNELESALDKGPGQIREALKRIEGLIEKRESAQEEVEPKGEGEVQEEGKNFSDEDFQIPEDAEIELLSDFVSESADLISNAEEALLALEADPTDMDAVGKVFRAFHTIKGTSAFLGLTPISEMAHKAENLLARVR
ncbi:MAG: Hpt domain-containing protein, partial [Desulfatiglandales bacterium]